MYKSEQKQHINEEAAKTFLISEFQYLLPNASLSEKLLKRCQKHISYYINKKKITKSPTYFLKFEDGGTSTTHLYFLYLATKIAWIPRLERYELICTQKVGYRPPSWAESVIKILSLYNTKAKYIKVAARGDLIKLAQIFEKFNLPFWQQLMNECIIVLNASNKNIDLKSEWANHRIFGSCKNKDINKRNATGSPELLDNNISIFNKDCHPFLDSELITLGAFIDNQNTQINYSKLFYSLHGNSIVPENKICTEVYRTALKIKKKFRITQHQTVSKDKLYFF